MDDDLRQIRSNSAPLRTEGTAWDIGNAALFLASDEARWINGVVLPVDAGPGSHVAGNVSDVGAAGAAVVPVWYCGNKGEVAMATQETQNEGIVSKKRRAGG